MHRFAFITKSGSCRGLRDLVLVALISCSSAFTVPGVVADTLINFEEFALGVEITTDYDGVTFSTLPGSCGGGEPDPVIATASGGTSSPTHVLSTNAGCPDFGPDYLRMVFDTPQEKVTFTLGDWEGTYEIRKYSVAAGGAPWDTDTIVIEGTGAVGVFRLVTVNATVASKIKRIEIEDTIGNIEKIDDLFFTKCDGDDTPPQAAIDAPVFQSCACGSISVIGAACDDDGNYGFDKLEYQKVGGPATWTQIGMFTSPLCGGGTLYTWSTAPAAITDGWYFLRLTVENTCGLQSTDFTAVYVDKSFTGISVTSPLDEATVCGLVEITGTVYDYCLDNYTVDYKPAAGGEYAPVNPDSPVYSSNIINCVIATWDTDALGVADGDYIIRIVGTDSCGNSQAVLIDVTVDNTSAGSSCNDCPMDLDDDGDVDGFDLALLLAEWGICP